ncbi:hypothetical protein BGX23_010075 [Mortierella sp. AD031]|nr:hypothetical protein BGX23_010075 [Mortierella sp. AD031]
MPPASLTKVNEITLKIVSPVLDAAPSNSITIKSQNDTKNALWTVKLTRLPTFLEVSVAWKRKKDKDLSGCNWMHIIPRSAHSAIVRSPINAKVQSRSWSVRCEFEPAMVTQDDTYAFDAVFTQLEEVDRTPTILPFKNQDLSALLLKDISSVDVCLAFTTDDGRTPPVGLWTHRVILSQHKVFAKSIQDEKILQGLINRVARRAQDKKMPDDESEVDSDASISEDGTVFGDGAAVSGLHSPARACMQPLIINVDKFSLATMCALLYFLYTGKILLSIYFSRFAITRAKEVSLEWRHLPSKDPYYVDWHPLVDSTPWMPTDVTWSELLEAADYYKISDLRFVCQSKVIEGINEATVVKTLFKSSGGNIAVKTAALEFIINKLDSIFGEGKDPFAPYRDHPACYDLFLELTRLRVKTARVK